MKCKLKLQETKKKFFISNMIKVDQFVTSYNSNDVNESYSRFLHIINKVSNKHAPLKVIKLKKQVI